MRLPADVVLPPRGAPTPRRVFRPAAARERLDRVARVRDGLEGPPAIVAAFSVKTNPRAELLRMARERAFFAEVISPGERRWAERMGFGADHLIYNGPLPLSAGSDGERVELAFADSVEAFVRTLTLGAARVTGVRLRPSMLSSRFGVPVEDESALRAALAAATPGTPVGVSFHARREDFGGATWRDVATDVLARAGDLQERTGCHVLAFDVGGGWTPAEFDAAFEPDVRWLAGRIAATLPACARLIVEPGQAVCTPTEALIVTVLEVRERGPRRELVVDGGYPDWPQMHTYPHALFAESGGSWVPVGAGPDRLLGRTCLEYDAVGGLRFPPGIGAGDRILIADTGSYDSSMAFDFGRGEDVELRSEHHSNRCDEFVGTHSHGTATSTASEEPHGRVSNVPHSVMNDS